MYVVLNSMLRKILAAECLECIVLYNVLLLMGKYRWIAWFHTDI